MSYLHRINQVNCNGRGSSPLAAMGSARGSLLSPALRTASRHCMLLHQILHLYKRFIHYLHQPLHFVQLQNTAIRM